MGRPLFQFDGGIPMGVRQRRVVGAILKVPLGGGEHGYAWTLPEVDFALFDLKADFEMPVSQVVEHPIAFRVGVNARAYRDGRWLRVGKVAPPPGVLAPVPTFIQDPFHGGLSIYLLGDIRPATFDECVGLERCAVWGPEEVEARLRDHFAGLASRWVDPPTSP